MIELLQSIVSRKFRNEYIIWLFAFIWVNAKQHTRNHRDIKWSHHYWLLNESVSLQSEIFESLLEEAEQMHIKRKEATEMLKVEKKTSNPFSV